MNDDKQGERKRRLCLKCQKYFWSKGAANRLCAKCNNTSVSSRYDIPLAVPKLDDYKEDASI